MSSADNEMLMSLWTNSRQAARQQPRGDRKLQTLLGNDPPLVPSAHEDGKGLSQASNCPQVSPLGESSGKEPTARPTAAGEKPPDRACSHSVTSPGSCGLSQEHAHLA